MVPPSPGDEARSRADVNSVANWTQVGRTTIARQALAAATMTVVYVALDLFRRDIAAQRDHTSRGYHLNFN
jgi:hypothetical protein